MNDDIQLGMMVFGILVFTFASLLAALDIKHVLECIAATQDKILEKMTEDKEPRHDL